MRAGIGPRPALPRAEVARRLELGVAQTGRIEQRGLRRLGMLDGAGECGAARAGASQPFAAAEAVAAPGTPTENGGSAGQGTRSRFGIAGVAASGGKSHSDRPSPLLLGRGTDPTLLVVLALLAVLGLLVRRELRHH